MTHTSPNSELYEEFAGRLRKVVTEARILGVEPRMLAAILLELSHEIARQGGPVVHYDHVAWLRRESKELLSEFAREYGVRPNFDDITRETDLLTAWRTSQ